VGYAQSAGERAHGRAFVRSDWGHVIAGAGIAEETSPITARPLLNIGRPHDSAIEAFAGTCGWEGSRSWLVSKKYATLIVS